MKDKRIVVFRKALEELVESLEATLRLANWDEADIAPDPLKDSASRLVARLGTTDRLAAGVFKGTTADSARVDQLTGAMRRLGNAYLGYRKQASSVASGKANALTELSTVLDEVKTQALSAE
jgi:hypothetical protein